MKKVLFATTALVASAGIASAQGVSLSGSAEMGVFNTAGADPETLDNQNAALQFHSDIDVTFSMAGATDGGLAFGASVDLDDAVGSDPALTEKEGYGQSMFISSDFGTITLGDTDGALDWALEDVGIGGSIQDDHTAHAGYNGNNKLDVGDNQILRYQYSFGDFAAGASLQINDEKKLDPDSTTGELVTDGFGYGIGATYAGDFGPVNLNVGAGYQIVPADASVKDAEGITAYGLSVGASARGFSAIVNYTSFAEWQRFAEREAAAAVGGDNPTPAVTAAAAINTTSHLGVGVGYTLNELTIAANYGTFANENVTEGFTGTAVDPAAYSGFGVAANYDLGGGAVAQIGYGSGSSPVQGTDETEDKSSLSIGIALSF